MYRTMISTVALSLIMVGCSPKQGDSALKGQAETYESSSSTETEDTSSLIVSTQDDFVDAVSDAQPGDHIVLADGNWVDFDALLEANGTADAPIRLSAQTPGKVILSGQSSLRLAGEHIIVSGLVFTDGYTPRNEVISFRRDNDTLANHTQVTNTVIENYSNPKRSQRDIWVSMYGKNNTFDFNHLSGKMNAGPTMAVRLISEASRENNHRIANNYFGPRPVFGSNGGETLRIGTSHHSLTQSLTTIENNYFDRCSGEVEIISNKSGGNAFRGNTFYRSRGTLTLRHGNGTLVENNLFDGAGDPYTGGVRVINAKQTIRNNYFKDLTGIRFSGALVVMNGVPNSPINRYHQVDGAVIENNTFDGVSAIELGEGSDTERSAVPINSVFRNNIVSTGDKTPFFLYDDMSGISFSNNLASAASPEELNDGFTASTSLTKDDSNKISAADGIGATGPYGVARDATGVSWFPKSSEASPFDGGRTVALQPGEDVLHAALAKANPGDRFSLAAGTYHESKISTLSVPVTITSADGADVSVSFARSHLFVLTGNGGLALDGLNVTGTKAPDGKGNSFIATSGVKGSGNHRLSFENMTFKDFDINGFFAVVTATKGSFFDRIEVTNSTFENISGTVFKLDEEADDYGIYNSEFLKIENSQFNNIGGLIASVYRGGRDESTFGPHVNVSGSQFSKVGKAGSPLMMLHGIQQGSFIDNTVSESAPIAFTITTGKPVFEVGNNSWSGLVADRIVITEDLRQ
jgi:poly(beta-D-mannuronate) lyase